MKITTSNNSGTLVTTSSNTTFSGTSTHTTYTPNIGNQFVYQATEPIPFSISFSWNGKDVNVRLKNGNDIFKLANAFMEWLNENEIEYEVKTSGKRKKK